MVGAGARPPPRPKPRVTAPCHAPHPPGPACPPAAQASPAVRKGPSLRGAERVTQERKQPCGACSRVLAPTHPGPGALMSRQRTVARQLTTSKAHAGGLGPPDSGEGWGASPRSLALPPQAPRPWAARLYVPGSIIFMLFLTWKKLETLNLSKLVGSYGTENTCGSEPGMSWATQLPGRQRPRPAGPRLGERPGVGRVSRGGRGWGRNPHRSCTPSPCSQPTSAPSCQHRTQGVYLHPPTTGRPLQSAARQTPWSARGQRAHPGGGPCTGLRS